MASREKRPPGGRDDSGKAEMARRLKTRPFIFFGTIFILVIVVIAFVFVPIMAPTERMLGDFTFGHYNRTPIRMVHGNFFHQVASQHNISVTDENMPLVHHVWRMAFDQTAIRLAVLDEMRRSGYIVPDSVVDREIAQWFLTADGRFDAAAYRAMDNTTRMNMWRQTQEDIALRRHIQDVSSLGVSSSERAFIGAMASERRIFNAAVFPLGSYPDSQVAEHAQANPEPFRATNLSRITASSESEAQRLLEIVRSGEATFEEAAMMSDHAFFIQDAGSMGTRLAFELTGEIWDAQARESIINLAEGELSDVVAIWPGADIGMMAWGFYRADEAPGPANTNDPLLLERMRNHIMVTNRGIVEDWVIAEAESFAAQVRERDFDIVAAEGNVLRRTFGPLPVNFGNSTLFPAVTGSGIPEIQGAGDNIFFWTAAFATPLQTPSIPVVLGDNIVVLFPVEEVIAEEFEIAPIESFFDVRVAEHSGQVHQEYFLASDRLDDRFDDTFHAIFGWRPPPPWWSFLDMQN